MSPERLAWLRGVVEAADRVAAVAVNDALEIATTDIRSDVLELLDAQGRDSELRQENMRLVRDHVKEQEMILDDLAQLLRVLGLHDGASSDSPRVVMRRAIAEAARMRTERDALRRTDGQTGREQFVALLRSLDSRTRALETCVSVLNGVAVRSEAAFLSGKSFDANADPTFSEIRAAVKAANVALGDPT